MSGQGTSQGDTAGAVLMDRIYGWQRHIYDMTRKPYLLGRDRLIADLQPPDGGTVLELGCGTARNLVVAAQRYPTARFFGIDLSSAMLDSARRSIDRAGLGGRVVIAQGDASAFDPRVVFGRETFDRVFVSYALSMIPPWQQALEAGLGLLGDGGELSCVDFGTMTRYPTILRGPFQAWLAAFHVTPRGDLPHVLSGLAARHGARADVSILHGGYAVYGRVGHDAARKPPND
ncbi:cyclopropane-fatty-acyl-phospholipid synthase family protein [Stappia sp. ES.058]|uniref:SAM-dependent methyltransferase n=1 Tax=Stappia sp. ES.058 TaxID=1881061 RepID=UPI000879BFF6|nr:class I SAM-dependent methyltransferase [Stappia sp. ES.058]SDU19148.1 S-adenosylmethionine-diacylgycerolhomoserine-N-methlytransferase [Stappia sp. ES.058]